MKPLRLALVVSTALIALLLWAVLPPQDVIVIAAPVDESKRLQCPDGSRVEGKLCACPQGSNWTGGACATDAPAVTGHGDRHVTTVDLRRGRRD